MILSVLRETGREDLIGFGKECLVPPERTYKTSATILKNEENKKSKKKTSLTKHLRKKKK